MTTLDMLAVNEDLIKVDLSGVFEITTCKNYIFRARLPQYRQIFGIPNIL